MLSEQFMFKFLVFFRNLAKTDPKVFIILVLLLNQGYMQYQLNLRQDLLFEYRSAVDAIKDKLVSQEKENDAWKDIQREKVNKLLLDQIEYERLLHRNSQKIEQIK